MSVKLIVEGIEGKTGKEQLEDALYHYTRASRVLINPEEKTLQVEGEVERSEVEQIVQELGFSVISGK